jgi:IS6 family transposase
MGQVGARDADNGSRLGSRAIFKWRQTAPELILCAVRWYLRYSLSLRDVEELLAERGLEADHSTIWRWGQRHGPLAPLTHLLRPRRSAGQQG